MSSAIETVSSEQSATTSKQLQPDSLLLALYALLALCSISIWFLALRTPLWTDETLSYWQIAAGFRHIWARSIEGNSFAAYAYVLWLTRTLFGNGEVVLRIPSILAMLAAAAVFYRCAHELFSWDVSLIATIMFVLPRGIAFAAIDVRPYAFALLVTNLTVLAFLLWMRKHETRYAALFGLSAGAIFYFHYLFGTVLVALALYYLASRRFFPCVALRQVGIAFFCFILVLLPVIPRLEYIYGTRVSHSFASTPGVLKLLQTLNPGKWQLLILAAALLIAAFAQKLPKPPADSWNKLLFCLLLGLLPILSLFVTSITTPIHIFVPRYLLVGVPGMTLLWGWFLSLADSRVVRASFCVLFVAACVIPAYRSPAARRHEESWKGALAFADANAAEDHAPLLMCSPLVEADFEPLPTIASDSILYSPLSYYGVRAPVVPLPRTFNDASVRQVNQFLAAAKPGHKRFLVLSHRDSLEILNYIADSSRDSYWPRVLGAFDEIYVVEFAPL